MLAKNELELIDSISDGIVQDCILYNSFQHQSLCQLIYFDTATTSSFPFEKKCNREFLLHDTEYNFLLKFKDDLKNQHYFC